MTVSKLKFVIPFTILFILVALLWNELSSERTNTYAPGVLGERVPSFNIPNLYGFPNVTNKALEGRVTILNFWASWCSACRAEHDMLMKIKNVYHIPIIGIAFKDDPVEARKVLTTDGNPYIQVASDEQGITGVDFGIYATPETFVVAPNGDVIYKQIGVIDQAIWDTTIYPLIQKYQS